MKKNLKLKTLVTSLIVLVVVVFGWQWYLRHFPSWDEEVLLSDGRMITVHRAHTLNTDGVLIETTLTFDLPEIGGRRVWREFLYPAIVDVYQGTVYVVGSVTYKSAGRYRDPKYGYVAFLYSPEGWKRVPFTGLPNAIRMNENVAFCVSNGKLSTWQEKQSGWCTLDGRYVNGVKRTIDLEMREANARKMAELSRTTPKSE